MLNIFRSVLAVVVGFITGSVVNMALIMVSGKVIPPPAGADVTTMEGLKASLHLFEPKHFLLPFLAHALGTFIGAFGASLLAPGRSPIAALIVGGLFLLGGIVNSFLLPAPIWFKCVDLVLAYLPTALLGLMLAKRLIPSPSPVATE